jgi:hypothetical protein
MNRNLLTAHEPELGGFDGPMAEHLLKHVERDAGSASHVAPVAQAAWLSLWRP